MPAIWRRMNPPRHQRRNSGAASRPRIESKANQQMKFARKRRPKMIRKKGRMKRTLKIEWARAEICLRLKQPFFRLCLKDPAQLRFHFRRGETETRKKRQPAVNGLAQFPGQNRRHPAY